MGNLLTFISITLVPPTLSEHCLGGTSYSRPWGVRDVHPPEFQGEEGMGELEIANQRGGAVLLPFLNRGRLEHSLLGPASNRKTLFCEVS